MKIMSNPPYSPSPSPSLSLVPLDWNHWIQTDCRSLWSVVVAASVGIFQSVLVWRCADICVWFNATKETSFYAVFFIAESALTILFVFFVCFGAEYIVENTRFPLARFLILGQYFCDLLLLEIWYFPPLYVSYFYHLIFVKDSPLIFTVYFMIDAVSCYRV